MQRSSQLNTKALNLVNNSPGTTLAWISTNQKIGEDDYDRVNEDGDDYDLINEDDDNEEMRMKITTVHLGQLKHGYQQTKK